MLGHVALKESTFCPNPLRVAPCLAPTPDHTSGSRRTYFEAGNSSPPFLFFDLLCFLGTSWCQKSGLSNTLLLPGWTRGQVDMSTPRGGRWCVSCCVVGAGTQGSPQGVPSSFWGSTKAGKASSAAKARALGSRGVRLSARVDVPDGHQMLPLSLWEDKGNFGSSAHREGLPGLEPPGNSNRPHLEAATDGVWTRAVLGRAGRAQADSEPGPAAPRSVARAHPSAPPAAPIACNSLMSAVCVNSSSPGPHRKHVKPCLFEDLKHTQGAGGPGTSLPHQLTDPHCKLVQLKGCGWVFAKFSKSEPN